MWTSFLFVISGFAIPAFRYKRIEKSGLSNSFGINLNYDMNQSSIDFCFGGRTLFRFRTHSLNHEPIINRFLFWRTNTFSVPNAFVEPWTKSCIRFIVHNLLPSDHCSWKMSLKKTTGHNYQLLSTCPLLQVIFPRSILKKYMGRTGCPLYLPFRLVSCPALKSAIPLSYIQSVLPLALIPNLGCPLPPVRGSCVQV